MSRANPARRRPPGRSAPDRSVRHIDAPAPWTNTGSRDPGRAYTIDRRFARKPSDVGDAAPQLRSWANRVFIKLLNTKTNGRRRGVFRAAPWRAHRSHLDSTETSARAPVEDER